MKRILQIILGVLFCVFSMAANVPTGRPPVFTGSDAEIELAEALKEIKELRKEVRDESKAAADARREAEHYYNLALKRFGA